MYLRDAWHLNPNFLLGNFRDLTSKGVGCYYLE